MCISRLPVEMALSKAPRSRSMALALAQCAMVYAFLQCGFALLPGHNSHGMRVARAAYDSGKVNLGVEPQMEGASLPADPALSCDEDCMSAISECLDEGCSVEAMLQLDQKLAETEGEIQKSIEEVEQVQKTAKVEGAGAKILQLKNAIQRLGSLRGQLYAMKEVDDSGFVQKLIKAASVAFGGGRTTDYPKVGVSPYSE